jgi:hypothetical protein
MKYFLVATLFIIVFSCSSKDNDPPINIQAETETLRKLEYDALVAEFKLDTASIASIMHDRIVYIGVQNVTNKQQELTGIYKNMSQRRDEGHTIDSFYVDQFRADVFGNTAIVSFFTVTKGMMKSTAYQNRRTRFYDIWIKENGNWKLVSMQATPITADN